MEKEVPLIKEYRIDVLKNCLCCFDIYMFNREKQRECVLKLYDISKRNDLKHWDKSIFRGMVIPSLKYLGLIYGEGDSLKISSNGKIIIESEKINLQLYERALRSVILELDKRIFGFVDKLASINNYLKDDFISLIMNEYNINSDKQKRERINKWLLILNEVGLISFGKIIKLNIENKLQTEEDIDLNKFNLDLFKLRLFACYKKLSKDNVGIAKIEDLRKSVSLNYLSNSNIFTEFQFDALLRKIPFESKEYLFSLGRPMSAQDKLFEYRGKYYNTLYIKFYS
jgi:hypothetical protein